MNILTSQLNDDLAAVLTNHNVDAYHATDLLGQYIGRNMIGNDIRRVIGGAAAGYIILEDVAGHLKRMVEAVYGRCKDKRFTYNDLDCSMWAYRGRFMRPCVVSSSMLGAHTELPAKPCARCHDTRKDPEFGEDGWFLVWDDHGNGLAFVLWENSVVRELHVRELPYNEVSFVRKRVLSTLIEEVPKGWYDTDYELIRYRDPRDTGFVLSAYLSRGDDGPEVVSHQTEATQRAHAALEAVVQHFPCVIEEIEANDSVPISSP